MSKIKIKSPEGQGIINTLDKDMPAIEITELGQVQIRIHFPSKGIWMKYNIGKLEELLPRGIEIKQKTFN